MEKRHKKLILYYLILVAFIFTFLIIISSASAEITYIENGWIKEPSTNESLISTYTNNKIENGYLEITKLNGFDDYAIIKNYDTSQIPIKIYEKSYNITHDITTLKLIHETTYNINNKNLKINNYINQDNYIIKIGFGTESYSGVTDAITVTGGTRINPIEFNEVYQEDQSKGWGQITKQNNTLYSLGCKIIIGNASTGHLNINNCSIEINKDVAGGDYIIQTTLNTGNLYIENSTILFNDQTIDVIDNRHFCEIERSYIHDIHYTYSRIESDDTTSRFFINESLLSNVLLKFAWTGNGYAEIHNTTICDSHYGVRGTPDLTHNLFIKDCTYSQYQSSEWFNDSYFQSEYVVFVWEDITGTTKFCDNIYENFQLEYGGSAPYSPMLFYNSFNLNTTNGATVKLYDKNGNLEFSTIANTDGTITEEILLVCNVTYDNSRNYETPFRLVISKDDYITYNKTFNNSLLPVNYDIKLISNDGAQGNMNINLLFEENLIAFIIWLLLSILIIFIKNREALMLLCFGYSAFSLLIFMEYSQMNIPIYHVIAFIIFVIGIYRVMTIRPKRSEG